MTTLNIDSALKLLREFSCIKPKNLDTERDREELRQAIILVTDLCDWQNFGICADSSEQALESLLQYLKALGYEYQPQPDQASYDDGAVYLKFNTQKMTHYLESYTGTYRGVLISCQAENDSLVGTYGHFPLNLFNSN